MFCPKGFVPLSDLATKFPQELGELYLATMVRAVRKLASEKISLETTRLTLADFLEWYLLETVCENTYASSPSGTVIRIHLRSILEEYKEYRLFGFNFVRLMVREEIPDDFYRAYRLMFAMSDEGILELARTLEEPPQIAWPVEKTYRSLPLFYERIGYTVSLAAYEWASNAKILNHDDDPELTRYFPARDFAHAANLLRPFEGWALCVDDDFANQGWPEALKREQSGFLRDPQFFDSAGNVGKNGGRPASIRNAAAIAYARAYPRGHGQIPWKVVLQNVEYAVGAKLSLDTLKRAIDGLHEQQNV